jgi:hypothetical protein
VYRAFMLDRTDHVFAVRILVTREDNAALRLASKIQAPCWGIEVWEGTRLLGQVEPIRKQASSTGAAARTSSRTASASISNDNFSSIVRSRTLSVASPR